MTFRFRIFNTDPVPLKNISINTIPFFRIEGYDRHCGVFAENIRKQV